VAANQAADGERHRDGDPAQRELVQAPALVTSPSTAPNTVGRSQPPDTSQWLN
jgi:hypothetical protein